ncbi:hypothetical protein ACOW8K_000509 [Vibrio parahaemolyticus]|nr:hypothetical protein [Vibrio parahaemolyticus]
MSETIIFIDDSPTVRRTYKRRLERLFGDGYVVECPELEREVEDMLHVLQQLEDKVAYFIDEDLVHEGDASFMGSELIERIRVIDEHIPIYILTSDLSRVDEPSGDIEFAIDKISLTVNQEEYKKRFFRHINKLKTVRSEQAERFDKLFAKSLKEPLTEDEKDEYQRLNVVRSRTLVDEAVISDESLASLDRQAKELEELYQQVKAFQGGNGE